MWIVPGLATSCTATLCPVRRVQTFVRRHPTLDAAIFVLGLASMLIGASGHPGDVANWGDTFSFIGAECGRWVLTGVGFLFVGAVALTLLAGRMTPLDELWLQGHELADAALPPPGMADGWRARYDQWQADAEKWIAKHISPVDARRFKIKDPAEVRSRRRHVPLPLPLDELERNLTRQLGELDRIRDEQAQRR